MRVKGIVGCAVAILGFAALILGASYWTRPPAFPPAQRAFFTAARRGDVAGLRAGLAQGIDVNAVEPTLRRTALMRAAAFDRLDAVKSLLASGADPRRADRDGLTALHIAAEAGAPAVIPSLSAAGADPNALSAGVHPRTPLALAVRAGQAEAARAILVARADPSRAGAGDQTPLEAAITNGRPDLVRILVSGGASLSPSSGASSRSSLVHLTLDRCDAAIEILKILLEAGADTTTRDRRGHTPLEAVEDADPAHRFECYPVIASYFRSAGVTR